VAREDAVDLIVMGTHGHTGSITCCSAARGDRLSHGTLPGIHAPVQRGGALNLRMATQHVLSLDSRGVSAKGAGASAFSGAPNPLSDP